MKKKGSSPWTVIVSIILAMAVGSWSGTKGTIFGITLYPIYEVWSSIFLNALMLLIVPLVASSMVVGVARIGGESSFKRLGLKTLSFYIGTNAIAVIIGLVFVNLINPGLTAKVSSSIASTSLNDQGFSLAKIIMQIIPSNIVDTLAKGNMLGLIFFSIIFGYCLSKVDPKSSTPLLNLAQGIFDTMIRMTHIVLFFLPVGVFFLVAKAFATNSATFSSLSYLFLSVVLGLAIFMFVALPLLIKFVGRIDPILYFRAMGPALITAFSTSSSSATLPVTLDCIEKRAGVSNRIASFVIPLGISLNMSGSALYDCVAVIFVAQAYGVDLSFSAQILVALLALVTSLGIAGLPSGGLMAIMIILKTLGLPAEGIGLFIAVERILDMCRATVNVFSDSTCALLVARSEGEATLLKTQAESLK